MWYTPAGYIHLYGSSMVGPKLCGLQASKDVADLFTCICDWIYEKGLKTY